MTSVVNVKVANIRPQYKNLKEWMDYENNIYIGRRGVVFINGERFPKVDSIWHNPFKINDNNTREQVIEKYRLYILEKIIQNNLQEELYQLKNKQLGCWCKPLCCHGDVLIDLINNMCY